MTPPSADEALLTLIGALGDQMTRNQALLAEQAEHVKQLAETRRELVDAEQARQDARHQVTKVGTRLQVLQTRIGIALGRLDAFDAPVSDVVADELRELRRTLDQRGDDTTFTLNPRSMTIAHLDVRPLPAETRIAHAISRLWAVLTLIPEDQSDDVLSQVRARLLQTIDVLKGERPNVKVHE